MLTDEERVSRIAKRHYEDDETTLWPQTIEECHALLDDIHEDRDFLLGLVAWSSETGVAL